MEVSACELCKLLRSGVAFFRRSDLRARLLVLVMGFGGAWSSVSGTRSFCREMALLLIKFHYDLFLKIIQIKLVTT